jgi:TonB family protein
MFSDPLAPDVEKGERFWTTFGMVLLLHAVFIVGAVWFSRVLFPSRVVEQITWLDGGAMTAASDSEAEPAQTPPEPVKQVEPLQSKEPDDFSPAAPTPTPTPTPAPTPKPKPTATPTPKPPTPHSPTLKPFKATPTPGKKTAKSTPTPKKSTASHTPSKTAVKPTMAQTSGTGATTQSGTKTGPGVAGGTGTSAEVATELKRYGELIEGKFRNVWQQPLSGVEGNVGAQIGVIRFRVAADGAVLWARISKSSGSSIVDDSLEAVCKNLTSLPPPPKAIQRDGFFESSIEMVLDR